MTSAAGDPRRDAATPFAAGRAVTAGIPHARFVALNGDGHGYRFFAALSPGPEAKPLG